MVTVSLAATTLVLMLKAGETLSPAATTTVAGTTAVAGSLLVSCTTAPPAGAKPVRVTVLPVAVAPPTTIVEATLSADRTAGVTVSTACLLPALYVAVMVTGVATATAEVVIVKADEVVDPAGTTTEAGATAVRSLLANVTTAPPAGAKPVRVTVLLVAFTPPTTDVEAILSADRSAGVTVSTACLLPPL